MKTEEIDTVKTEHNFLSVNDPVPVNRFDDHSFHLKHHREFLAKLTKDYQVNPTTLLSNTILLLDEHIANHEQYELNSDILE